MKQFALALIIAAALLLTSCNAQNLVANMQPYGTPIPTLLPATPPAPASGAAPQGECRVRAVDLLGAWVNAGSSEADPFEFQSANGVACIGSFAADVAPLFKQSNLWFKGAIACVACHGPDLNVSYAQLSLVDTAGIKAGSRRLVEAKDILGGGTWEKSKLYEVLVTTRFMPLGRPADMPDKGPLVMAGKLK